MYKITYKNGNTAATDSHEIVQHLERLGVVQDVTEYAETYRRTLIRLVGYVLNDEDTFIATHKDHFIVYRGKLIKLLEQLQEFMHGIDVYKFYLQPMPENSITLGKLYDF